MKARIEKRNTRWEKEWRLKREFLKAAIAEAAVNHGLDSTQAAHAVEVFRKHFAAEPERPDAP